MKHRTVKDNRERQEAADIFNLDNVWMWVVIFKVQPCLFLSGLESGGPQSRYGLDGEDKKPLQMPELKLRSSIFFFFSHSYHASWYYQSFVDKKN